MAGSSFAAGAAGSSALPPRRNRRLNQPRRSPFLGTSRVNTISIDGVTTSVSTVAKERPNTIAEESAIHHCVAKAEESLHVVTGTPIGAFSNKAEQRFGRLRSELEFTSIDEILDRGMHEFIDDLQIKLNAIGDAVDQCFFGVAHVSDAQVQRQEG